MEIIGGLILFVVSTLVYLFYVGKSTAGMVSEKAKLEDKKLDLNGKDTIILAVGTLWVTLGHYADRMNYGLNILREQNKYLLVTHTLMQTSLVILSFVLKSPLLSILIWIVMLYNIQSLWCMGLMADSYSTCKESAEETV